MPKESPCKTMLRHKAAEDRIINHYPQALFIDATPYIRLDFHPKVRIACIADKTGTVGLKISKAIIVGDLGVGKTSIVNRFCHKVFDRDYKATIGVDFEVERFDILEVPFNLQIWDTAGQERFRSIASTYYRGAHVIMLVFDLTNIGSLESTRQWLIDANKENKNPHIFLIGTKKDICCSQMYQSSIDLAQNLANDLQAEFWAVSSKSGENIPELMFRVAALTFEASVLQELEGNRNASKQIGSELIQINKQSADESLYEFKRKSKCCST